MLFVTARGAKKWHFRFTWLGKQQRVAISSYPEISLKDAREQRDDLRAQVARGVDPRVHRLQVKAAELAAPLNTFASIFDIDNPHLLDVLRRIKRRQALTTAEKVRTWFNQLFRYAMVEKGLRYNPASDLDIVAEPKPPVSNTPFLRMDELPAFLQTLRSYGGQEVTRMGLRLLLLTGVRTGELRQAVPEQFDLERGLWIIPPVIVKQLQLKLRREGKTIPPYIVSLPQQAIDIVRVLIDEHARRPAQHYLLSHRSRLKERISENTLNGTLHRMGYADRLIGHGIRATISTALNELGYPKEWIEVQLSHSDPNKIRAAYNHADYVEQRRMMQDWADRLDVWERGEPVIRPAALVALPPSMAEIESYLRMLPLSGGLPRPVHGATAWSGAIG